MIKFVAEWLIDWIVVMFIIVVGLFIIGIGFVFYPFKKIRYFCGEKSHASNGHGRLFFRKGINDKIQGYF